MTHNPTCLVADVRIVEQQGFFHASSADIPGLHICGRDRSDVLDDVIGGIMHIYKMNKGMDVAVEWAAQPAEANGKLHDRVVERFVMRRTFQVAA